jgi:hypothetical protein
MKEQYDDFIDDDYEYETDDTFVENINNDGLNYVLNTIHKHKNRRYVKIHLQCSLAILKHDWYV